MSNVIEAAGRFGGATRSCEFCPRVATVVHIPKVDHRKRKPWPTGVWTCEMHDRDGNLIEVPW